MFFFEKKNQKTFPRLMRRVPSLRIKRGKSFLLLFSSEKRRLLPTPLPSDAPAAGA
jgi:hypothetical protein